MSVHTTATTTTTSTAAAAAGHAISLAVPPLCPSVVTFRHRVAVEDLLVELVRRLQASRPRFLRAPPPPTKKTKAAEPSSLHVVADLVDAERAVRAAAQTLEEAAYAAARLRLDEESDSPLSEGVSEGMSEGLRTPEGRLMGTNFIAAAANDDDDDDEDEDEDDEDRGTVSSRQSAGTTGTAGTAGTTGTRSGKPRGTCIVPPCVSSSKYKRLVHRCALFLREVADGSTSADDAGAAEGLEAAVMDLDEFVSLLAQYAIGGDDDADERKDLQDLEFLRRYGGGPRHVGSVAIEDRLRTMAEYCERADVRLRAETDAAARVWDSLRTDLAVFKCPKCKSTRTATSQAQTRSGDEAMTNFVQCLEPTCRHRFIVR